MMRKTIYKRLLTGLLCVSLLSADLMPAGIVAFAAEPETMPITETELPQEEDNTNVEENRTNTAASEVQDMPAETSVTEDETQKSEVAEDKLETEEIKSPEEDKSDEPTTEIAVTEDVFTKEITAEESVTEETETIDESNTELKSETETEAAEFQELLASDHIASGKYKNISWVIDKDGKLTVTGKGEFTDSRYDYYARAPWYEHRKSIKSAEINVTDLTVASYMFYDCSNMTTVNLSSFDTRNVTTMYGMFYGCSSLTSLNLTSFNTGKVTNMWGMFSGCSSLTSLNLGSFDTRNVTSMGSMFWRCRSLASLNFDSFDTHNVTFMSHMFVDCGSLTSLNLDNFNTAKVTNMNSIFEGCSSLTSLNLSSFDTCNVTDMGRMFYKCSNLATVNLSSFDTAKVTSIELMFYECSSLTDLNLDGFNTANVTNMARVFEGCSSLTSLNVSGFNTANVTDMKNMFYGCKNLTALNVSGFNTVNVTDMHYMFHNCSSLASLNLNDFNTSKVTDMYGMFSGCSSLTSLNLSSFDTCNVTTMQNMFYECRGLVNLDVGSFNTVNVTDMGQLFCNCSSLTSLNLSTFNTGKVTRMTSMFMGCSSLTELDLSSFNTSNVTDMGQMFNDCSSLISLNLSSFNTAKVTSMRVMFDDCSNLTELKLGNFNTMNLTSAEALFAGCSSLTSLNLSNFDTRNITDMSRMFYECNSLTSLDLSSFNTANVTDMGEMFQGCSSLTNINLSSFDTRNVTDMRWMFSGCSSLTSLNLSNFDMRNLMEYDPWNSYYTSGMDCMFSNCASLSHIEFSDNVTFIGLEAFRGCNSLNSIAIPDGVEYIRKQAFYKCENLTSVTLPNGVTSIGDGAFEQCQNLSSIELPGSIKSIGDNAFRGCRSLSGIEIPNSVTYIGKFAFRGCAIGSIVIPDGVTYISYGMFDSCSNLSSVELPNSVTYIDDWAFNSCRSLNSIEIPNGVTGIGQYVFSGSYGEANLGSIELPVSLTDISDYAFYDCYSLHEVYYAGYEENWKAINIGSGNESLTNANIHYASTDPQTISGVLRSGDGWKINWKCTYKPSGSGPRSARLEINILDSGTEEELYLYNETGEAFPWELEPYNIPKSAINTLIISGSPKKKLRIPTNAFKGYSNLYSAVFSSVSGVDSDAFEDCKVLNYVGFTNGTDPTFIGKGAFKNCYLTQIDLPDNLQSIGAEAFQNTSLKTIFLGSSIKEIGENAFSGCKNLLIYCTNGSYAHQYALENHLPFKLSMAGVTNTRIQKKEIPFYGWDANKTLKMDWGWDLILKGSSDIYDNRLAKIALALSSAAESSESNVKNLMSELGAVSIVSTLGSPQMTMGYKTITQANGDNLYVFVIVCRGTSNTGDGIADVLSSAGAYDWSASALHNGLNKYINQCASENNTTINKNNIKIFMTGHSLGGASTNMVAEQLNSDYGTQNVFAYTFAAPSPLKENSASSSRNIHNIICLQDNVPLHLSTRKSWYGYGRLGKFSVKYRPEIEDNYRELTQKTLKETWDKHFFFRLHPTDVYMAYLLTNPRPYETSYYQIGGSLCPTDIKIYNSAGELAGSITNNRVDEENRTMDVMLTVGGENNDEKYFYFLTDDTYTVEITGTDTGTMKYVSQYVNMNTDAVIAEKAFTNVTLTKGKKMTSTVSAWDKADTTINTDDKIDTSEVQLFVLDNNDEPEKEVLPDGNGTEVPIGGSSDDDVPSNDVLPDDIPESGIPNGLWVAGINEAGYSYTGEALIPAARVYDKTTLLAEKTDYTIAYKNNVNVGEATITVTGKGNYSGKETFSFNITPVNIESDVYAGSFYVKTNAKKAQKPVPELYYMGTKLKYNKDFTITYSNESGIYAQDGEYSATVTGKNNYTGTKTLTLMAVSQIPKKKPISIAKATLTGFEASFTYTGKAIKQTCTLKIQTDDGTKNLVEGADYTVHYANNIKAGTATITYYGTNGYSDKLKKTYKILPYDIVKDSEKKISYDKTIECVYAKGGAKPKPSITFDGKILRESADYTLSYKNNKAVGGSTSPCVTISGKGSFQGKIAINFTITPQDLSKMTLVSCDKVYNGKAGMYKITPKLMDLDGKILSAGKDFDKNSITYTYEKNTNLENGTLKKAGEPVADTDIIPADTQIRVTLNHGSGSNYTGTFSGTYRIVKADIKSAKVTIPTQIYTGSAITPGKEQIKVTLNGNVLHDEDYDIVLCTDNVKKGKASITINGKGNYGGTKTVKFTIAAKGFLWWWR